MGEHVAVEVDAGGDLAEQLPVVAEPEHRPLGDVVHLLAAAARVGAAESALLQPTGRTAGSGVGQDAQVPPADRDLRAGGEGGHEPERLGVLADVDEPAGACQLGGEAADVDVALGVHLGHAEEGLVQPAAVVEVEHVRLVDDGLRVGDRAEAQAAGGEAADPAGLHRQGDEIEDVLLVGDRGHALGHADAEVHDRVGLEREGAPTRDGLARAGREHGQPVERGPDLAGVGGVGGLGEGLRVVLGAGHHDAVDEDAGDLHFARVEHVCGGDALHLDQHDATGVLHGLGDGQHLDGEGLALHGDVALRVRGGSAQEGDVDRKGGEEEVFAARTVSTSTRSSLVIAFMRPPSRRGSMNVSMPTVVMRPGRPAAISRYSTEITPCGKQ